MEIFGPSKKANTCTHLPQHSLDGAKANACSLLSVDTCLSNADCQVTPHYGILHEEGLCSEGNVIQTLSGPKTEKECNQACIDESTEECNKFGLGRANNDKIGECILLKGETCTSDNNKKYDTFSASPRFPSRKSNVCTHSMHHVGNKAQRDACKAISDRDTCIQFTEVDRQYEILTIERLTWNQMNDHAQYRSKRIPTVAEGKAIITSKGGSLVSGNVWVPVGDSSNIDWM